MKNLALAYAMKKKKKMAEGGDVSMTGGKVEREDKDLADALLGMKGNVEKMEWEESPEQAEPIRMAEGGKLEDMVSRIMAKCMSKGGQVANDVDQFESSLQPNEFDDLVLRDDMEFNYTGANSGDEIGNHREDHDRKDIVAKIMASRRKKDNYPTAYWSEIANDPKRKRS